MTEDVQPPGLTLRTFARGKPPPLFVRVNRRAGAPEFCRSEARFDGRGAGRKTPYPLKSALDWERALSGARRTMRLIAGRAVGSKATASKAAIIHAAIQDFALSVGWPARHATKKVVAYFAPLGGKAPKHLRRGQRTVMSALKGLRKKSK